MNKTKHRIYASNNKVKKEEYVKCEEKRRKEVRKYEKRVGENAYEERRVRWRDKKKDERD